MKIEIHCFLDSSIGQKLQYTWTEDEVQTARMLFYIRVIPTCIERVPTQVYRKVVAPTMFLYPVLVNVFSRIPLSLFLFFLVNYILLPITKSIRYMGHPNAKVARASHSVFIAFISGKDDDEDGNRVMLKEELVFYYIERSLSVSLST